MYFVEKFTEVYPREVTKLIGQALNEGCGKDAPGSFLTWVSQRITSYAMEMPGKRFDVGDIASYTEVQQSYKGICKKGAIP